MKLTNKKLKTSLALVFFTLSSGDAVSEAKEMADTILKNGRIYTQSEESSWVEALAIKNGKILATGTSETIAAYEKESTEVINLEGKMAMPGIIDAHSHPVWGGLKDLYRCNFPFSANPEKVAKKIKSCVESQKDITWIQGGNWSSDFFDKYDIESPIEWLDAITSDKAVVLKDDTNHHAWLNSKALDLLGIDESSQPYEGATYVKDPETGKLNGLLMEAGSHLRNLMPDWTEEQYNEAVRYAVKRANSFGITGLKDADAYESVARAYHQVASQENLTANVAVALRIPGEHSKNTFNMNEFSHMRDSYNAEHVDTNFVKIYLDGVPTSSRSAAMLDPYPGHEPHKGELLVDPEVLTKTITELDRRGFTVKVHTTGDRAVRITLDAIQQAREKNGNSGLSHELAHAALISESDMPRIESLGVAADLAPYIWFPSPLHDNIHATLGERAERAWPAKSLVESGVLVVAGSDWPASVEDIDPWIGIETLITRAHPEGKTQGTLWKDQAITLKQALEIFTINGAKALKIDHETGSIEPGKSADIIVLNHDLFEIAPEEISQTRVLMTLFEGRKVYLAD